MDGHEPAGGLTTVPTNSNPIIVCRPSGFIHFTIQQIILDSQNLFGNSISSIKFSVFFFFSVKAEYM